MEPLYFDCEGSSIFGFAQALHTIFVAFFVLDNWQKVPTAKQILQVGLLHCVQMPPPSVSNLAPQTWHFQGIIFLLFFIPGAGFIGDTVNARVMRC
jgi:hypothetical protein